MGLNGAVKVSDFGKARYISEDGSHVPTLGKLQGNYSHSAPEIYFGKNFSMQSDVYSLGIILWEMVNCAVKGKYEQPYSHDENIVYHFQIIIQSAKQNLRPLLPTTIPEPWRDLISRCWQKEPENRPDLDRITEDLQLVRASYLQNKAEWDALLGPRAK